ncbi:putative cytochrome p450 protein [Eutypa lata UCREL1]|uniref:Putative cytochrome p450 protein n=1 Tax=Eutypa lata (strain UCR-EL1) TaxID=1287681 RepID=M7SML2_EUTLA|nr:putative cytochrome p450 protein [Eutypa lata UCREL1]
MEAKTLPYLQAVIYEGLRIHPPFTGLLCKKVPPEGDTYDGKFIPGGTRIAHSTWSIMRNKQVFGEDVEVFRPERWLGIDDARRTTMERTVDLAFGYGRWACAGKTVSFMELNKFYVELLRHFDFQLVNPTQPWHSVNQGFFLQKDMWVKVTER